MEVFSSSEPCTGIKVYILAITPYMLDRVIYMKSLLSLYASSREPIIYDIQDCRKAISTSSVYAWQRSFIMPEKRS
jgi:hypothetical protein